MSFGDKLKKLRLSKGLSLREVSERSDVSHPYISQIENKNRNAPKPRILRALSVGLDEDYKTLMMMAGYVDDEGEEVKQMFEIHLVDEVVELEAERIDYHDDHITFYDKELNLVAYFNKRFVKCVIKKS